MSEKSQILFLSASPREEDYTSFKVAFKEIQNKILTAQNANQFTLNVAHGITIEDLQQLLEVTYTPQIVHFYGHAEEGFLELENDKGEIQPAKLRPFAKLFGLINEENSKKIKLVVLIACNSRKIAKAVSKYVDCTIGMKSQIDMNTGREFTKTFYYNLCSGKNLQYCFDTACLAIDFKDLDEQDKPQLIVKEGLKASDIFFPIVGGTDIIPEIKKFVDEAVLCEWSEALPELKKAIDSAPSEVKGEDLVAYQSVLNALEHFFEAERLAIQNGDFDQAEQTLKLIPDSISEVGAGKLVDLANGFRLCYSGIAEVRKQNINHGLNLLNQAKAHFQKAGKFDQKYQFYIQAMEPDILYNSALSQLQQYNYVNAKMLIDQAYNSSKRIAVDFFDKDSLLYNFFLGNANAYRAIYNYQKALQDYATFNFEAVQANSNSDDAKVAMELLSKSDTDNAQVKVSICLLTALGYLQDALSKLSKILQDSFSSDYHPTKAELLMISDKIEQANSTLSDIGELALPTIRYINQMSDQVKNIEKLLT